MGAFRQALDGGRWHLQHGPIDIVLGAEGEPAALALAHAEAWARFQGVLDELVAELRQLRRPVGEACLLQGPVAQRMWRACYPFRAGFITPMAAVAGAVAQELIAFYRRPGIQRAWVNNGGDIALHLARGQALVVGLYADLARLDAAELRQGLTLDGRAQIPYEAPVRGIATSGWRGRSHSLGIADSVTVLARTAAQADAAATVIANAVNVEAPQIVRQPASSLKDDSDLGDLLVTVAVPPLPLSTIQQALAQGLARAKALQNAGLIESCTLVCQGQVVGTDLANRAADDAVEYGMATQGAAAYGSAGYGSAGYGSARQGVAGHGAAGQGAVAGARRATDNQVRS